MPSNRISRTVKSNMPEDIKTMRETRSGRKKVLQKIDTVVDEPDSSTHSKVDVTHDKKCTRRKRKSDTMQENSDNSTSTIKKKKVNVEKITRTETKNKKNMKNRLKNVDLDVKKDDCSKLAANTNNIEASRKSKMSSKSVEPKTLNKAHDDATSKYGRSRKTRIRKVSSNDRHSLETDTSRTNIGESCITGSNEDISTPLKNVHHETDTGDSDFEEVESADMKNLMSKHVAMETQNSNIPNKVSVKSDLGSSDFEDASFGVSRKGAASKRADNKSISNKLNKKKTSEKKSIVSKLCEKRKNSSTGVNKFYSKLKKENCKKTKQKSPDDLQHIVGMETNHMVGVDVTDVTSVLLRMEGHGGPRPSTSGFEGHASESNNVQGSSLSDESEDEDWEEVKDHHCSPFKSQIPNGPVEITLEAPDFMRKKRKKKKFDWKEYVQRIKRRFKKETQIGMHKVHLLCLLSHGFHQNNICNSDDMRALALSVLPDTLTDVLPVPVDRCSLRDLKEQLRWFQTEFCVHTSSDYFYSKDQNDGLVVTRRAEDSFVSRRAPDSKTMVIIFVVILRTLGFDVRLLISFQPMALKINTSKTKSSDGIDDNSSKTSKSERKHSKPRGNSDEKVNSAKTSRSAEKKMAARGKSSKLHPNGKEAKKTAKQNEVEEKNSHSIGKSDDESKFTRTLRPKNQSKRNMEADEADPSSDQDVDFVLSSDDNGQEEFVVKRKKTSAKSKKAKQKSNQEEEDELSSGSQFEEEEMIFRSPLRDKLHKKKIRSSESSNETAPEVKGSNVWTEVYLPAEKRWVCVDCVQGIVDQPYEIEKVMTKPVHYVVAYSADGAVRDVTARYASHWLSQTQKLRVDSDWWAETLLPYKSRGIEHDKDEQDIKDQLMERPLPTTVGQYKNHPLYALTRHLLKFEAIYPECAVPFGYIREEPVYARECVHTLHSRENWLKEGRAVRLREEPYKMVKSRKRWKQPKLNTEALDLELFGYWQTEKYIPDPAIDGRIPRNGYGNLELFKPWMLPEGTVHLQGFPALHRIAKKLGMDCVPAMVGWEAHSGFSHPLIDGWIVCTENKDILIAAWDEDQEIQKEREIEKRERRALGNWKLLTRSLLIKERLKKRFNLKETELDVDADVKTDGEIARDVEKAWPVNRLDKNTALPEHIETM